MVAEPQLFAENRACRTVGRVQVSNEADGAPTRMPNTRSSLQSALFAVGIALSAFGRPQGADAQVVAPSCKPGAFQVMLLGIFHFAGSSDDFQRDVIDVLATARQQQLDSLAIRVAQFRPTVVAVEYPYSQRDSLSAAYRRFRVEPRSQDRNEVTQLGFRLAHRLGLADVAAIDYPMGIGNDSTGALLARHPELAAARTQRSSEIAKALRAEDDFLRRSTLIEYFRHLNARESIETANEQMYRAIELGEGANYGGPLMLARWYERNLRIASHLFRSRPAADTRAVVIIGAGHVRPLEQILNTHPDVCIVNPLPFLR